MEQTLVKSSPVTLILTHRHLTVVSVDEDSATTSFGVNDTDCIACPSDPTKFFLRPRKTTSRSSVLSETAAAVGETSWNYLVIQDRIMEFVKSTMNGGEGVV